MRAVQQSEFLQMKRHSLSPEWAQWLCALAAVTALCLAPALRSQDTRPPAFSKGLRVVEVYPGTQQIKSYLTCDELLVVSKGLSPGKGLRIITCTLDGKTNLIVLAP